MNSMLQCLMATDPLRDYFGAGKQAGDLNRASRCKGMLATRFGGTSNNAFHVPHFTTLAPTSSTNHHFISFHSHDVRFRHQRSKHRRRFFFFYLTSSRRHDRASWSHTHAHILTRIHTHTHTHSLTRHARSGWPHARRR
jgi:hypothetical protein